MAIEPGRVAGRARRACCCRRVVDVKQFPGAKRFVVLDAGMTELMRPALYNAFHRIEPVDPRDGAAVPVDIVGPICESTDAYRARSRCCRRVEVGDLVVVRDVGAYGAVMGSHLSTAGRCRPKCSSTATQWRVIRRRQTLDELLALETE